MDNGRGCNSRRQKHGETGFEDGGGYMAVKKAKLEEQFKKTTDEAVAQGEKKTGIFSGVAIYVNGHTDPTADELKRIMMLNGGVFHHYPSHRTTHTIAKNLPDTKMKNLKGNEVIVHPKWIVESLEKGYLLDYKPYLIYVPGEASNSNQRKIDFQKVKKGTAMDATNQDFLQEFYGNSRLHLISKMKADFKKYVYSLRQEKEKPWVFPDRQRFRGESIAKSMNKVIAHVDMDCFFASVSLRKYPNLQGMPVAVAHAKAASKPDSSSEIASCNYTAREQGVRNGMFLGRAKDLCPDLKIVPYDFEGYQEVARILYDVMAKYTLDIQAVSCDEMLVDLTSLLQEVGISARDVVEQLRQEVFVTTGCTASVGMGPNVLLAKLATRKAKPNGVHHLEEEEQVNEFMMSVKIEDLPGIGRKTKPRLLEISDGAETCADLLSIPLELLKSEFGEKTGTNIYQACRGISSQGLEFEVDGGIPKSVSSEVNYGIRFTSMEEAEAFLEQLSDEVYRRLCEISDKVKAKLLTLKLMVRRGDQPEETWKFMGHGICDSFSKSFTFNSATRDRSMIWQEVQRLFKNFLSSKSIEPRDLRGIGVQLSKLEVQGSSKGIEKFLGQKTTRATGGLSSLTSSQIDPSVLKELPEEIRKEIEQEMGYSFSSKDTRLHKSSTTSYDNISYSQLDEEVLKELPKEVQEELWQQLGTGKNERKQQQLTAFDKLMSAKTSDRSPLKNNKKTKRHVTPAAQPSTSLHSMPSNPQKSEISDEAGVKSSSTKSEESKSNLNGAREIKDLRPMLRTWIQSTDEPTDDDLETVTTFLKNVIVEGDMEIAYAAIKCLHRHCNTIYWKIAYDKMISGVQESMIRIHGKKLFCQFV